ncbi:type II toxin-antitoxin system RelE/ParE family toxin [Streptomyces finlayi]|uniref:Type II toxin-antitoxin system RelE/ParE family toxin n=1 Tax=Streptomyces finlayi TaxID=67296 RepID=A0A7G7BK95_9ACTN|nr:type II toxin-antitoxin system RelE/ParE family toxin [Streptomyces finlayi]QNE75760.1 type II toxin-antitoxin system RelE/ParE family toxin [Streptomyces finlayi]
MGYVTQFTAHAQRDLLKIPLQDARRLLVRFAELQKAMDSGDLAAFDIKPLQGHHARWRLRVGDYHAVYTVEDGRLIIWVMGGHRSA